MPRIRKAAASGVSMHEAFECYICRKVMALFGADASRCPGCGSVHGKSIAKHHVGGKAGARSAGARARRRATKR
jgi:ribosomal protein L40E